MNFGRGARISLAQWKCVFHEEGLALPKIKRKKYGVFTQVRAIWHCWKCKKMKLERQESRHQLLDHLVW